MSLNQKYTWNDFLKENPSVKEKKMKRTSAEATKAFEAAFKKHVKEYLKGRLEEIDALKVKVQKKRDTLTGNLKEVAKKKNRPMVTRIQNEIGRQDAWLSKLTQHANHAKTIQKNF